MQRLIQPINKMTLTASRKNVQYLKKYGFEHFGIDCAGSEVVYAQGDGKVIAIGTDSIFGNFAVVEYIEAMTHNAGYSNVVARYFHMSELYVLCGQSVNKDTRIGLVGSTGKYVDGKHLHVEFDSDTKHWNYTPTLSGRSSHFLPGVKGGTDTTVNPMLYMWTEESTNPIAHQTYAARSSLFVNENDRKELPKVDRDELSLPVTPICEACGQEVTK